MHPVVLLMRLLAPWPLGALRALGWVLGHVLLALARSRRRIVQVNLALCFPNASSHARAEHCPGRYTTDTEHHDCWCPWSHP